MQTQICTKCGESKALSEYHRDERRAVGARADCKECVRLRMSLSQKDRKAYYKQRYSNNKDQRRERDRRYAAENREKQRAKNAVKYAVKTGRLKPVSENVCIGCGNGAEEYHHHSYATVDRLNVIPLCKRCHKRVHVGSLAIEFSAPLS